ncbi:PHP domain-containing protein [Paracoccus hibiscisoli]|uniref:PHP domain-containing protein n=1 Tax=Paracoccus hibiscisoli TaxID=2023261 RepID=A0A4U0QE99_9RHOB|nr:PHP domain-containing protein [Paracoccus hibiscisoli]TJZ79811.1 PHP domain-containing protein [Paracoccus hibiscisoli]
MSGPSYVELQVTSQFSFLRGASSAEELFATAALMGVQALAVTDRNSLAGIVRAHVAAKETGVRLIVGCRLDLACGMSLLVYPTDRPAYSRLCRLLSVGKGRAGKGKCHLEWADLAAACEGLIGILIPDQADDLCALQLRRMREAFGDRAHLALTLRRRPNDQLRWSAPIGWSSLNVSAWSVFGLSGRCFSVPAAGMPKRCAA